MNNIEHQQLIEHDDSSDKRRSPFAYDEAYINAFVQNPHKGKTAAYRVAIGGDHNTSNNRAYDMHLRLKHRIDERLKEMAEGAIGYGMAILFNLCETTDSDNVKAACAAKLVDYGLKFTPVDLSKHKSIKSREQLKTEIENTRKRLKRVTNTEPV